MINRIKTKQKFGYYPEELALRSLSKVIVTCDYCNMDVEKPNVSHTRQHEKSLIKKDCCQKCRGRKLEEIHLLYPDIHKSRQEKICRTNVEKYGVEYYGSSEQHSKEITEWLANLSDAEKQAMSDKAKITNLEKYQTEYPMQNPEIQQKAQQSLIDKFGVHCIFLTPDWEERRKQIMVDKYGVEYAAHIPESEAKRKKTNIEKFGTEFPSQNPEIQKKIRENNFKKYGHEHIANVPEFQEKSKSTILEKYGVEYVGQIPEVKEKIAQAKYKSGSVATSQQQLYLHNLYGGELNFPITCYWADLCLPDKVVCEYDGGGHFVYKQNAEDGFLEIIRGKALSGEGYRVFRIISRKDKLPPDEILLKMLDFAKETFNSGRSWITFDIDNSSVKWNGAENKYDFGKLRKINLKFPKE
jgi:very-short-patch-repair endonuclease